MKKNKLHCEFEQRMYYLVMYNISAEQKGIQCDHAQSRYALKYFNTPEYQRWITHDLTVYMMKGGTSNRTGTNHYNKKVAMGSMELYLQDLKKNKIPCAEFYEPDLNNSTSAIAFLVDERAWDYEKYPEPILDPSLVKTMTKEQKYDTLYKEYVKTFKDKRIAYLRIFIKDLRFA